MSNRTLTRLRRTIVVLALAVTAMAVLMVAGAVRNDVTIGRDEGRATADVLSVTPVFAAISFITPDGVTHSPKLGVLYPTGLSAGQRIDVEYSLADPDLVRVAGRNAGLALLPAGSLVVLAWGVAGGLLLVLRRVAGPGSGARHSGTGPSGGSGRTDPR
ncbi:DUF3592 domain-containing protein [Rhodococcus sp. X156]|uniref:DUF3592 domain-containing protein n=1 Tax=Rhodococcus sp. X156 TaxID=2499145 RepID=UPI00321622FA